MQKKEIKLTGEQDKFIKGFSWEAFLAPFWFSLFNELWWYTLGTFIPFFNIYIWVLLTIKGKEIAWDRKDWINYEQYKGRVTLILIIALIQLFSAIIAYLLFAEAIIAIFNSFSY